MSTAPPVRWETIANGPWTLRVGRVWPDRAQHFVAVLQIVYLDHDHPVDQVEVRGDDQGGPSISMVLNAMLERLEERAGKGTSKNELDKVAMFTAHVREVMERCMTTSDQEK